MATSRLTDPIAGSLYAAEPSATADEQVSRDERRRQERIEMVEAYEADLAYKLDQDKARNEEIKADQPSGPTGQIPEEELAAKGQESPITAIANMGNAVREGAVAAGSAAVEAIKGGHAIHGGIRRRMLTEPLKAGTDILDALTGLETGELAERTDEALKQVPGFQEPEGEAAQTASEAGAFIGTMLAAGPIFKAAGVTGTFMNGFLAGGVADFVSQDPHNERLFDMANDQVDWLIPDRLLEINTESDLEGRIKNFAEGGIIGSALEGAFRSARWVWGRARIGDAALLADDVPVPEAIIPIQDAVDVTVMARDNVDQLSKLDAAIDDILEAGAASDAQLREIAEFQAAGGSVDEVLAVLNPKGQNRAELMQKLRDWRDLELPRMQLEAENALKRSETEMIDAFWASRDEVPAHVRDAYRAQLKKASPKGYEEADRLIGESIDEAEAAAVRASLPEPNFENVGRLRVKAEDAARFRDAAARGDGDGMAEAIADWFREAPAGDRVGIDNFDRIADGETGDLIALIEEQLENAGTSARLQGRRSYATTERMAREQIRADAVADGIDVESALRGVQDLSDSTRNLDVKYNAARIFELALGRHLDGIAELAASGTSPRAQAEFYRWFTVFAQVNDARMGARGQIGRALSSMKIVAKSRNFSSLLSKDGGTAIGDAKRILEMAGGEGNITALANAWLDGGVTVAGRRAFARMGQHKVFANALAEMYRASRLSSPRTLMRNTIGGVTATVGQTVENLAVDVTSNLNNGRSVIEPFVDQLHGWREGWRRAIFGLADRRTMGTWQAFKQGNVFQAARRGESITAPSRGAAFLDGAQPRQMMSKQRFAEAARSGQLNKVKTTMARFAAGENAKFTVPNAVSQIPLPGQSLQKAAERIAGRQYGLGGVIVDALGWVNRSVFAGMQASDELIKSINYHSRLRTSARRLAYRIGKEGENNEMFVEQLIHDVDNFEHLAEQGLRSDDQLQQLFTLRERAQDQAARATFTDDYNMSKTTQELEKLINNHPMARTIVPFTRTPTRIQSSLWMERTPLAVFSPKTRQALMSADAETKHMAWSRLIVGTGLTATAAWLAMEGLVRGAADDFWEGLGRESMARKAQFAVKVGDTWVKPTGALEPVENLFFAMSTFMRLSGHIDEEKRQDYASALVAAIAENALSRTYMKSLLDFTAAMVRTIDDGEITPLNNWIANTSTGFIPAGGLVADFRGDRDPVNVGRVAEEFGQDEEGRTTLTQERSLSTEVGQRLRSRTPDALEKVIDWMFSDSEHILQQPMLDFWGRKVKHIPAWGPDILSPFQVIGDDELDEVSLALIDNGYGTNMRSQFGKIPAGDTSIPLTAEQMNDYIRFTNWFGEEPGEGESPLHDALSEVLLDERLTDKTDEFKGTKGDVISGILKEAKGAARAALFAKYPKLEAQFLQKERNATMAKDPSRLELATEKERTGELDADILRRLESSLGVER